MRYTIDTHRHNFAIWTSGKSIPKTFKKFGVISEAINSTSLLKFVGTWECVIDQIEFDHMHKQWCITLIQKFNEYNLECSYGIAAKIVAIYLKTSITINTNSSDALLSVIHPFIDNSILKNLPKNITEFNSIRKFSWLKLDEENYFFVIKLIREKLGFCDWRLEMLWRPELD